MGSRHNIITAEFQSLLIFIDFAVNITSMMPGCRKAGISNKQCRGYRQIPPADSYSN